MRILIVSNCQGRAIGKLLKKILKLKNINFNMEYIKNYSSNEKFLINLNKIVNKNFDVCIYQPLRSDIIINLIKDLKKVNKNLIEISFPYIFCDGLACLALTANGNKIRKVYGEKPIIDLLDKKFSKKEIVDKFFNNQIDFKNCERVNNSIKEIRRREQTTTIKVSDFIEKNYKTKHLFLSNNHPSTVFFEYLIKNILNILKIEYNDLLINKVFRYEIQNGELVVTNNNIVDLEVGYYVLSKYDKGNNKLSYFDREWKKEGFKMIKIIIRRYNNLEYKDLF